MNGSIDAGVLVTLLFAHLVGDFFLQNRWMANNKSSSVVALTAHVAVYALCGFAWTLSASFIAATFVLHWLTDFVTSRLTSELWKRQEIYWFFAVIGVDQFLHVFGLVYAYVLFLRGAA